MSLKGTEKIFFKNLKTFKKKFKKGTDSLFPNIFSWMIVSEVIFLKVKEWIGGKNVGTVRGDLS